MAVLRTVEPLQAVNSYGLFAVMTTHRDELIVEGSDGRRKLAGHAVQLQAAGAGRGAALGCALSTAFGLADVVRRVDEPRRRAVVQLFRVASA